MGCCAMICDCGVAIGIVDAFCWFIVGIVIVGVEFIAVGWSITVSFFSTIVGIALGTVCVVFVIEVMFGFVNGVGTVASVFSGVVIPCVVFCLSIVSIFSSVLIDLLLLVVFAIESFGTSSIFVGIVLGVAFISGVVFSFLIFRN